MEGGGDLLIVGLGNPGVKYERTRHNFGFMVVMALAKKYHLGFKRGWRLNGKVASGTVCGRGVHLLIPSTYMNLSGIAVSKAMRFYKVALESLVVVVDDLYVTFGATRFRAEGGSGGHNGLKSIQAELKTQLYPRLRMGIGPKDYEESSQAYERRLEEYVLEDFTPSELQELPQIIEKGVLIVEEWVSRGVEGASRLTGTMNLSQKSM
jgi:PTH1 family peptidyl-tRNA hydrolase